METFNSSTINGLGQRLDSAKLAKSSLWPIVPFNRYRQEVLPEEVFRQILLWERKRAERSGRWFLLMLVRVESVLLANQGDRTLSEIASALSCSTRETDITGWYREGSTVGVIFTETHKAGRNSTKSLIRAKVEGAMRAKLDAEQVNQILFSFHIFPEDCGQANVGRLIDPKLYPDLFERGKTRKLSHTVKRLVDIVGSLLAMVLCSPLWIAISLAIKLTSDGPILFRQERVGRYGLRFTFLKFRSMKYASDPGMHQEYVRRFIAGESDPAQCSTNQKVVYKIQDDPRVTRVGKFLRRTSLDELPQLINVLRGDMSLVGPRPPIPYELETYQVWHRRRLLEAKPGITGLWQVNGRSRLRFDDMVRLDLEYARRWSLWWDFKILLQTPRAVLLCEGAY